MPRPLHVVSITSMTAVRRRVKVAVASACDGDDNQEIGKKQRFRCHFGTLGVAPVKWSTHRRSFTPANSQTIRPLQWWIIAPAFSAPRARRGRRLERVIQYASFRAAPACGALTATTKGRRRRFCCSSRARARAVTRGADCCHSLQQPLITAQRTLRTFKHTPAIDAHRL